MLERRGPTIDPKGPRFPRSGLLAAGRRNLPAERGSDPARPDHRTPIHDKDLNGSDASQTRSGAPVLMSAPGPAADLPSRPGELPLPALPQELEAITQAPQGIIRQAEPGEQDHLLAPGVGP